MAADLRSPLALHMPDADALTRSEIAATLDLSPAAMLILLFAMWDNDKGVAEQTSDLVRALGHDRLYVRFHADPHPPGYARKIGGPEAWGRLCSQRMTQYYQPLADAGVQLHAILANETDADYEGGLSVDEASDFYRRAMGEYAAKRPQDILHVPAPTGAPSTHREHLQRFNADGWIRPEYWIDGHGYDGDLENVLAVLEEECPGHQYVITETNDLADFGWPIALLNQGRVRDIVYFTLNWARGGEGRVQPPTADDAAKQMSLMRFPARYAQFKATIAAPDVVDAPEPAPVIPDPVIVPPAPEPVVADPWRYWTESQLAIATGCPQQAVVDIWPRVVSQLALCGIDQRAVQAVAAGTIAIETASTFRPVVEAFWLDDDWRSRNLRYYPWFGRGLIQLTWESNYAAMTEALAGLWGPGAPDLIANPDAALDPDVSAAVLALFFRDHGVADAARDGDLTEARRLVQGGDAGLPELVAIVHALDGTGEVIVPPPAGRVTFDAATPAIAQNDPASCSATSLRWALTSLGRHPDERWIEDTMVAEGVMSWDQGLLDASGSRLAAFIWRQYQEYGFYASSHPRVSFDDVAAESGSYPLLLGGRSWGHWTGCRGYDAANDLLLLANPASGWQGVYQTMNREQFDALGPFSMVRVLHPDLIGTPAEPPAEEVEDVARIAELEQQIRDTWGLIGEAYKPDGSVRKALDTALAHAAPHARDTKAVLLKRLNDLRQEVESVQGFLRSNNPAA